MIWVIKSIRNVENVNTVENINVNSEKLKNIRNVGYSVGIVSRIPTIRPNFLQLQSSANVEFLLLFCNTGSSYKTCGRVKQLWAARRVFLTGSTR